MDDEPEWLAAPKQWRRIIARSNERARTLLATSPKCVECGGLITTRGPRAKRHYSCEPAKAPPPEPDSLGSG